tara:strand:- start:44408 stop:46024 length:1617 start_codon:yes stop_codon:yes gene_type:complete
MPRTFSPGHRPDAPLYPEDLAYTSLHLVAEYLQLPLPDPVKLAGNSAIVGNNIKFPLTGADYRRWGWETDDVVLVYDDTNAMGTNYTVTGIESVGTGGQVYVVAAKVGSESFTADNNSYIQHTTPFTNSNERGIKKSHVQNLIRIRQDYIDRVTRHAWRPRLVAEEYLNFTTFKPFRRRYYTDYVGAVFVKHGAIQQILKMGAWQGDYYREMACARVAVKIQDHTALSGQSIVICPGANGVATLTVGTGSTNWRADFDHKSTATNLAALINQDPEYNKAAIQLGSLTVETQSNSNSPLNLNHEFLALANSDTGDGVVEISSMRSTEGGQNATIAMTHDTAISLDTNLHLAPNSIVMSKTGSPVTSFVVDSGSGFTNTHGLVYIKGAGDTNRIALCTRNGNTFTVVADQLNDFDGQLQVGDTIKQIRMRCDINDEERQKSWWSIEENGQILFNNEYPFFENHSLRMAYIYGERYVDKNIQDACTKLVVMDIIMSDDYSVMFPEGTQNIDLATKHAKLEAESQKLLVPFQESIIVAGMGG